MTRAGKLLLVLTPIAIVAFAAPILVEHLPEVKWFLRFELPSAWEQWRHESSFDPDTWKTNSVSDPFWPPRLCMVDDLLASKRLDGLTRHQVEALLGPPKRADAWLFPGWDFVYWLGPERGLVRIDSEWLVLRIGRDGRVAEYRLARD